jgi:hypothetical protein
LSYLKACPNRAGYLQSTVSGNLTPAILDVVRRRAEVRESIDRLVLRGPVLGEFDFSPSRRRVFLSDLRIPGALRRFALRSGSSLSFSKEPDHGQERPDGTDEEEEQVRYRDDQGRDAQCVGPSFVSCSPTLYVYPIASDFPTDRWERSPSCSICWAKFRVVHKWWDIAIVYSVYRND